tara:strand:- start:1331 stop:2377 length:1047 start_codon:yes stop_codon:yes gene_type:complete
MVKDKKTQFNINAIPKLDAIVPADVSLANTILHDSAPVGLNIEDKSNQINPKTMRNKAEPLTQVRPTNQIDEMATLHKQLVKDDFPSNSFLCAIAGSRRTGKSTVCESLLCNELKDKFDTYFLFSPTLAGFDTIPNTHKFSSMSSVLPKIIKKQQLAVKNNIEVSKRLKNAKGTKRNIKSIEKDYIESRVVCILDDMLATGELKNNKLLNKIATNGRHICSPDKSGKTDMSFIILSQSVNGLDPVIRRNTDILLASRLTSKKDRETLVLENMILDSSRGGIGDAYNNYDGATLNRDYGFIALLNHVSNKSNYEKYVRSYKANVDSFQDIRLCGDDADWEVEKPFFDFV